MTDVYIRWEDGKETVESFKNENEFFEYINEIQQDTGISAEDYSTYNPEWTF